MRAAFVCVYVCVMHVRTLDRYHLVLLLLMCLLPFLSCVALVSLVVRDSEYAKKERERERVRLNT